jgi:hypothetical protein
MEFFNKKQDVIDIELTSYGRQLLAKGLFKPVYYAFSDDGIVYDSRWISGSNADVEQSDIEQRIQEETPRLKVQARKTGADNVFFTEDYYGYDTIFGEAIPLAGLLEAQTIQDLNEKIAAHSIKYSQIEAEKLLENTIGTKPFTNSFNPAWNILFYNGEIGSTSFYYQKNDIVKNIPQLDCTLQDVGYRLDAKYDPYETLSKPRNVISHLEKSNNMDFFGDTQTRDENGVFFEQIGVIQSTTNELQEDVEELAGTFFIEKDFLFISVEEANVNLERENFMIEVFEVTTTTVGNEDGEESLRKMFFGDESGLNVASVAPAFLQDAVENVFHIEIDDEINSQIGCYLIGKDKKFKNQSIYISNVFDCETQPQEEMVSIDPYSSLPEVDTGDVC